MANRRKGPPNHFYTVMFQRKLEETVQEAANTLSLISRQLRQRKVFQTAILVGVLVVAAANASATSALKEEDAAQIAEWGRVAKYNLLSINAT